MYILLGGLFIKGTCAYVPECVAYGMYSIQLQCN